MLPKRFHVLCVQENHHLGAIMQNQIMYEYIQPHLVPHNPADKALQQQDKLKQRNAQQKCEDMIQKTAGRSIALERSRASPKNVNHFSHTTQLPLSKSSSACVGIAACIIHTPRKPNMGTALGQAAGMCNFSGTGQNRPILMSNEPAAAQIADSVAAANCCCSTLCTPCLPRTVISW